MALELDIFQDTTANTMFADSTMAAEQEEQYVPVGYSTDQDGNFVNDNNERVYYWVPSSELGDVITSNPERALYQDTGGYYTEDEIRAAWDADEGMGYLKEQTDWDNYWSYLTERQGLIQDGTLFDATGADAAGRQARQDVIQEGGGLKEMGGAKGASTGGQNIRYEGYSGYYQDFLGQPEQMALMSKYGISPVIQNQDGDVFGWNGSSYTKVVKVDDHNYGAVVGELIKAVVISAITGGIGAEIVGGLANVGGIVGKVATGVNNWLTTTGAGMTGAEQLSALGNTNLIVNFANDITDSSAITDVIGDDAEGIENEDGTTTYNIFNLPSIYSRLENGDIVHTESGTVMASRSDYDISPYGARVTFPPYNPDTEPGGGGAAEDPSASNDDTGASADSGGSEGSGIVNETGEEVTTGGEEVDGTGTGTQTGAEYRWKYIGNGCFVQIDENGVEISGTKVCDPDYTKEDYSLYEVGGIFGRGTDAPFGSSDDEGEDTTSSYEPPPAGTDVGYECLPNGDKVVYTADGNGGSTTEVIKGGCLENEGTGGVIVTGGDDGNDSSGGTTDSTGDTATGEADEDANGDGTEGTGESGAGDDGVGDDGTGEGEGGDGNGDGKGNGITSPAVSGKGSYEGTVQGLSYVAQPVPGMLTGTHVDAMSQLNGLMAELMNKRENLV